jgi:hypothetical protein
MVLMACLLVGWWTLFNTWGLYPAHHIIILVSISGEDPVG